MSSVEDKVTCVHSEQDFQQLVEDWNRLASLTDPESVFLRHEWFDSAWQWLKQSCSLHIVCVWRGPRLIGVCPLVLRAVTVGGLRMRALELLSIPDTQYCDVLADPADGPVVIDAVVRYLSQEMAAWDYMELGKVGDNSNIRGFLPQAARDSGFPHAIYQDGTNLGVSLKGSWEAYYGRRSRRLKKGNNHVQNKLLRSGKDFGVTQVQSPQASEETISRALETAVGLSAASWKNATGLTLDNPGPRAFIERLTEHAYRRDWLSVWLFQLGETPAAMEYQLTYNGIVSALRADYDPAFESLSPGSYLNWKLLEQLFGSSMVFYSMGPGTNPYKLRWAEEYPTLTRVVVYNRTVRGRLLAVLNLWLRPYGKRLVNRLPVGFRGRRGGVASKPGGRAG